MFAVIRTGGKQYQVKPGDVVRVEKLDKEIGSEFEITDVLSVSGDKTVFGSPMVAGAKVTVVVTNQDRGQKVVVFKKKRRQGYRRTIGHRQSHTEIFVKAIESSVGKATADSEAKVFDKEKTQVKKAKKADKAEASPKTKKAKAAAAPKKVAAPKAKKKTATKKPAAKKKAAAKKTTK